MKVLLSVLALAGAVKLYAGPSSGLSPAVEVSVGATTLAAAQAVPVDAYFRSLTAAICSTRLFTTEIRGLTILVR